MQEDFSVTIPSFHLRRTIKLALISLLISSILIYIAIGNFSMPSLIATLLGAFIIYIILIQNNSDGLPGAVSPAVTPPPKHLGLDGVSLKNRATGVDIRNIQIPESY